MCMHNFDNFLKVKGKKPLPSKTGRIKHSPKLIYKDVQCGIILKVVNNLTVQNSRKLVSNYDVYI